MSISAIRHGGLNLVCEREDPFGEKYDLAIITHSFTANRNTTLTKEIANKLCDENVASVRLDSNGYDDSDDAFEDIAVWNEAEDANVILFYVKSDPHANHIYLVSLSQGGVVASMFVDLHPDSVEKVVLLAPIACLKDDALEDNTQGVPYNPRKIPDSVPLRNKSLGGPYLRAAQNLPAYEIAQDYCGPISLIYGTGDRVIPAKYVEKCQTIHQNNELYSINGVDHHFSDTYQNIASGLTAGFLKPDLNVFQDHTAS